MKTLAQWLGFGAAIGVAAGCASALFLWLLERVTSHREAHSQLILALPLAGLAIGWIYQRYGEPIRGGNNLVIDTIHDQGPQLPLRMAPMVLIGTVLTHLFGGSAGREGTAVQMGASLSDALAFRFPQARHALIAAGVSGGFGSVFGTPIAGALFGLEFVTLGRIDYRALVPCTVAAVVGDLTTRAWGVAHTHYPSPGLLPLDLWLLGKWALFAIAVALVSVLFIELTHALKALGERQLPNLPARMFVGGALVVLLWVALGTSDYLGLGVPMIVRAFEGDVPSYAFLAKLVFTAITLGAGFLGGEVTPLFFIGATLGATLAPWLALPQDLAAGVGMAAVFATAAKTPLALSVMAVELLGGNLFPHVAIVCVLAYVLSGQRSIYPAQLRGVTSR
ncbi:MAG TPA: chloride channel protein [Polyangiales bacterium]|nr:chloride channel protein [Polyangiales bacterium]